MFYYIHTRFIYLFKEVFCAHIHNTLLLYYLSHKAEMMCMEKLLQDYQQKVINLPQNVPNPFNKISSNVSDT